jgi:hypothetical protein
MINRIQKEAACAKRKQRVEKKETVEVSGMVAASAELLE